MKNNKGNVERARPTGATECWTLRIVNNSPRIGDYEVWKNWLLERAMVLGHSHVKVTILEYKEFKVSERADEYILPIYKERGSSTGYNDKEYSKYVDRATASKDWLLSMMWSSLSIEVQDVLRSKQNFSWSEQQPHLLLSNIKKVFERTYSTSAASENRLILLNEFKTV